MSKLAAMREADQIASACIWLETIAKQCLDGKATNLDVAHLVSIGTHQRNVLMHTEEMHTRRAILLKKRTCSMCGKTAPNSSRAFAYCGGCRHASIPRVDRPRYCSEECQRAHWLAGHCHECPCTG